VHYTDEISKELNFNFERSEFNGESKGADDYARYMSHIMANVAIVGTVASLHGYTGSGEIKKVRDT
jgi:hypothetical protein